MPCHLYTYHSHDFRTSAGTMNFLNTAPACELPEEMLELADIICPNEPETEMLTGLKVNSSH